jgi:hypothetical protein
MANMDFGDAFDTLADDDFWMSAVMAFVGFVAPVVAANVIEGQLNQDLPNELYSVGIAASAEMMGGYRMITVGSGIYVVDSLAQRFSLKQRVSQLGGA